MLSDNCRLFSDLLQERLFLIERLSMFHLTRWHLEYVLGLTHLYNKTNHEYWWGFCLVKQHSLNSFFKNYSELMRHILNNLTICAIQMLICWNCYYRWTWIWRTTVRRIFAYDRRYAWSQSDAYQVFVICIRWILHMMDQFSWSNWVCHIQVHLY